MPGGWWGWSRGLCGAWGEDGILEDVTCSAWIPAAELQPSRSATERPGYAALLRPQMPTEGEWPALVARPNQSWHHYGRLDEPPGPVPGPRPVGHLYPAPPVVAERTEGYSGETARSAASSDNSSRSVSSSQDVIEP